jgi:hypothetical protein
MAQAGKKMEKRPQKLLGRMREAIWPKHYSMHSEAACATRLKPHRHQQLRTPWTSAQGVPKNVPQIL